MLSELDKSCNPCYRDLFFLPVPGPLGAGDPFWERPTGACPPKPILGVAAAHAPRVCAPVSEKRPPERSLGFALYLGEFRFVKRQRERRAPVGQIDTLPSRSARKLFETNARHLLKSIHFPRRSEGVHFSLLFSA